MSLQQYILNLPGFYEREMLQKKVRDYFRTHQFSPEERLILIDWMLACIDYYAFPLESFFLAVSYFDLYMSCKSIQLIPCLKLQCIGASCIWLALTMLSQDDDMMGNFLDMVSEIDPESKEDELKRMLVSILQRFQSKAFLITPFLFLTTYLIILRLEPSHNLLHMSKYILELSQYDEYICVRNRFKPSLIATAALYTGLVALRLTRRWISDLSALTPYNGKEDDLMAVHHRMLGLLKAASPTSQYRAVYARYSRQHTNFVALIDYSFIQ